MKGSKADTLNEWVFLSIHQVENERGILKCYVAALILSAGASLLNGEQ